MAYKSRQAEIIERLIRIEEHNLAFTRQLAEHLEKDEKFQDKVLGNGKPGMLDGLHKRVESLETVKVWMWGLFVGGGTMLGLILNKMYWTVSVTQGVK